MGWTLARVTLCAVVLAVPSRQAGPNATQPYPPLPTLAAEYWDHYVQLTGERRTAETPSPTMFLALDFTPTAAADRQALQRGEIPIAEMRTLWSNKTVVNVPDHWVHHWRGAVLLRGAKLDRVFNRLREEIPGTGTPSVPKASIVGRDESRNRIRTYMQVQRVVTVAYIHDYKFVYDTWHDVEFSPVSPTRLTSKTVATKIAQLENPGTPGQRELKPDEENRYLLRWNSFWRYEETASGVIAECESITLSRDAGFLSALGARTFAAGAAKEAITDALTTLRSFFQTRPSSSPAR